MNKVIERMNFPKLWEEYIENKEDWTNYLKTNKNHWYRYYNTTPNIMANIMAEVAKWKLVKNEEGKIDGKATLSANLDYKDPTDMGLYIYLTTNSRNLYNNKASSNDILNALVPIIPCAFKIYNNIPYEMWDRNTIAAVVSKNLSEAMVFTHGLSEEELLEARAQYVQDNSPYNWYPSKKLNMLGSKDGIKNKLIIAIMLQIWIAHPTRRTKYMILDPMNWDNMPEPIIDDSIFLEDEKPTKKETLTWDDLWDVHK